MKNMMMAVAAVFVVLSHADAEYRYDWWKNLALESTPTNDLVHAAMELDRQEGVVSLLYGVDYCAADAVAATNLWTKLAVLHGDVRSKKMDVIPTVLRNFGIITNQVELQHRRAVNQATSDIRSYQISLHAIEERIETVFSKVSKSEALSSFSTSERNAIVSNIVELARFTPDEAASLGLTNVVLRSNIVERARLTEAEAHTVFDD